MKDLNTRNNMWIDDIKNIWTLTTSIYYCEIVELPNSLFAWHYRYVDSSIVEKQGIEKTYQTARARILVNGRFKKIKPTNRRMK